MYLIHAEQIKAARAYLDWTREDLAQATGLSSNTIRNLEAGNIYPRGKTALTIRQTLEEAGIEFTEGEGIRRRISDIAIFRGIESSKLFFEDILQTVKKKGCEVFATFKSQELMSKSLGIIDPRKLGHLEELNKIAVTKCLLPELKGQPIQQSQFQFRIVPKHCISSVPTLVYGDRKALVLPESGNAIRFVVIKSFDVAQSCRDDFASLWEIGIPISGQRA